MLTKTKRKAPEIVIRNGKPAAVIIDIDDYQELLERLEDVEDLQMLAKMRSQTLKFKKLEDFLKEYGPGVAPGVRERRPRAIVAASKGIRNPRTFHGFGCFPGT
jgi:prevent-host-death family protein